MKTYEEYEEAQQSDTEITLGMRSILGIFIGLVLICGVFFGLGYSLGRGNGKSAAALAATAPSSSESAPMPEIKTVVDQSPSAPSAPSDATPTASANSDSQYSYVAGPGGPTRRPAGKFIPSKPSAASSLPAPVAQPVVNTNPPAASPEQAAADTTSKAAYSNSTPAHITPVAATPTMVQIAAVSRPQDAQVLVAALQQHGFTASVHSDSTDKLLHVQIGPFPTREAARAVRTRLLGDGYNAILK